MQLLAGLTPWVRMYIYTYIYSWEIIVKNRLLQHKIQFKFSNTFFPVETMWMAGPPGPPGPPGKDGRDGNNGNPGVNGQNGLNGQDGKIEHSAIDNF